MYSPGKAAHVSQQEGFFNKRRKGPHPLASPQQADSSSDQRDVLTASPSPSPSPLDPLLSSPLPPVVKLTKEGCWFHSSVWEGKPQEENEPYKAIEALILEAALLKVFSPLTAPIQPRSDAGSVALQQESKQAPIHSADPRLLRTRSCPDLNYWLATPSLIEKSRDCLARFSFASIAATKPLPLASREGEEDLLAPSELHDHAGKPMVLKLPKRK